MSKIKLIKQLEYLVAFQADCLSGGDWESFDRVENEIRKIEEKIMSWKESDEKQDFFFSTTGDLSDKLCRDCEICQ